MNIAKKGRILKVIITQEILGNDHLVSGINLFQFTSRLFGRTDEILHFLLCITHEECEPVPIIKEYFKAGMQPIDEGDVVTLEDTECPACRFTWVRKEQGWALVP